jgi:hypothetical protein
MNTLETLPVEVRFAWMQRDVDRLRDWLANEADVRDGVFYWQSNGRPVPPSSFKEAFVALPAGQQAAHDADQRAAIAEYREARKDWKPSAEEMYEMRAAFGTGKTVVDMITGQKVRL